MRDQGAFQVVLSPSGRSFRAAVDRPLLQSAQEGGIALESSCRNGSCRACLRRLLAGEVDYRIAWPGLIPEERSGGWVLPCVAYPRSDLELGD